MLTPEPLQGRDVMGGVIGLQAGRHHLAAVDHEEGQDADRAVPGVLELLLLDRAGDRPADRAAFEHLLVGHLVGADDPDLLPGQPFGVGVAPEHLLGPLLEPGVQPGGPPVAGPVRLEIDAVQDPADGAGGDRRDDAVEDGLPGQILDAQPGRFRQAAFRTRSESVKESRSGSCIAWPSWIVFVATSSDSYR